jgi:hypothetical protein
VVYGSSGMSADVFVRLFGFPFSKREGRKLLRM